MNDSSKDLTRGGALKQLIVLPALAGLLAAGAATAEAADNKKQFKYQDKPGKNGQKCSGCSLFKPPHGCQVVTGTISPSGWCTAWNAKR
ncbi:MAG: high-potential iron-sulfur protein [Vulcanimicrobiaceae bacterium]